MENVSAKQESSFLPAAFFWSGETMA